MRLLAIIGNMKVITRFAPSPTGNLHIGGVRTALFNYLFTKKYSGTYLLRIDDTDKTRSSRDYEKNIIDGFTELGLLWDNKELIRQSERTDIYRKHIEKLIAEDKAYLSREEVVEEGNRPEVIRLRNPNKKVVFQDLIRGEVEFDTTELGDFVIARSITEPVYHFASVVDDFEMSITHVIRAEEHLSNTPRQILIQEAIGAPRPIYAHIPIILAPDRSKLSKRHGATALTDFMAQGYIPEALINYLAFLGWNPGNDKEIYSLQELVRDFEMEKVQKAGAIFNIEKLNWYNRQYIAKLSPSEFLKKAKDHVPAWLSKDSSLLGRLLPLIKEKISVFSEINQLFNEKGELNFVQSLSDYESAMLLWKKNPDKKISLQNLTSVRELLRDLPESNFSAELIRTHVWPYAEKNGKGDVLWPLRVALTGQEKSPDPFVSAHILGKYESLKRIETAQEKLK